MLRPLTRIYWDSCVFISYLQNDPDRADTIAQILDEVDAADDRIITTSQLSLVEEAYVETEKEAGELDEEVLANIEALWSSTVLEVVELNPLVARIARDLLRQSVVLGRRLRPADAIHIATAKWVEAQELQTYDLKLASFSDKFGMVIREPHLPQPRLPGT